MEGNHTVHRSEHESSVVQEYGCLFGNEVTQMVCAREDVAELFALFVVDGNAIFRANPKISILVHFQRAGEVAWQSVFGGILLEL